MKHLLSLFVLAVFSAPASQAADEENPFKKAKEGDWVSYKMNTLTMGMNIDCELKMTITAKSDKEAVQKTTVLENGKELSGGDLKIDLTKPFDPSKPMDPKSKDAKVDKLDEGKEKVKIGTKEYDCTWVKVKSVNKIGGKDNTSEIKVWTSKTAPLGGIVKMEMKSEITNLTLELKDSGSK